jgi:hypothetical protein
MEILFSKTGKKIHVFSCKRKDGSWTWKQVSEFFIMNDLAHYAVETILPLKNAFLGIVASGMDIHEFELPKEQRKVKRSPEAIFAEHLVNIVVIYPTQEMMENQAEFMASILDENMKTDFLKLISPEKLEMIRETYNALMKQWTELLVNETMKLMFEE